MTTEASNAPCSLTTRIPSASRITAVTRGKTAASRRSGRKPARASLHAAVLPPGPPPTTMTSCRGTSASDERQEDSDPIYERDAQVLDRVREPHGREQVTLDVDVALDIGLGEIER